MIPRMILALTMVLLASGGQAKDIRLAVTTSFHNSGLSDVLLPEIRSDIGLEVQLLVVGTGQALRLGEAGDVDAILVHSRQSEEAFVAAGFGTHRREIMYNDFVLVGPGDDPAGLAGLSGDATVADALTAIKAAKRPFVSRGDDSGTHKKELALWQEAGFNPAQFEPWYRSVGAGMGAALNTAAGLGAYILTDQASWLNFGNKAGLALLYSGDRALFNQYAYLPVNPERHAHVKHHLVAELEAWLVSDKAASLINGYTINGETLFVFNGSVPAGGRSTP